MLIIGIGFGGYKYHLLNQELKETKLELETRLEQLGIALNATEEEKEQLRTVLQDEQARSEALGEELEETTEEKEKLEKLTELDPELLKKYSKVYFLSEHYVPERLAEIQAEYVLPAGRKISIHDDVAPFLADLLEEATEDGLNLRVVSGYRSFEEQKNLKSSYVVTYGVGANRFSAEQGYSEHQLGTTVDFGTVALPYANSKFETTPEFAWLVENADRFGFTLSYPKNNAYYKYEPWHWRFVGRDLADDLADDGTYLYDLDQREIDSYLLEIFD